MQPRRLPTQQGGDSWRGGRGLQRRVGGDLRCAPFDWANSTVADSAQNSCEDAPLGWTSHLLLWRHEKRPPIPCSMQRPRVSSPPAKILMFALAPADSSAKILAKTRTPN